MTEFALELAYPTTRDGRTVVEGIATWKLDGKPDELVCRGKTAIPIRVNAGMIDDATMGKAERKFYARVLNRLSSFVMPDGEVEAEPAGAAPDKRVQRSSLNDPMPGEQTRPQEAAAPPPDTAASRESLARYREHLRNTTTTREVNELNRTAVMDPGISAADKTAFGADCLKATKAIKAGGTPGQLFQTQASATEQGA